LKSIYERLEPADPDRNAWLFGGPTFDFRDGRNWHEMQEEHRAAQRSAVEEILGRSSPDAVIAMAGVVRLPRELGHAIATAAVPEAQKDELLERALVETESKLEEFGYGMLFALRQVRGDGWLLGRFRTGVENAEDPGRLVRLALALPANREHWDVVASAGTETENAYWSGIDDHAIPETSDPVFIIDKLLSADRGGAALTWVGAHPRISVPSSLVVAILRHASTTNADKLAGGPVCTSITSWQCSRGWMTILRLPSRKSPASNGRITVCLNIPTAPRSDCKVLSLPIPVSSCICLVVFIFRRVVPMLQKPSLRKEKEM
jgi:hypothetical protein